MNPNIELIKKYLADNDSVTSEELDDAAEAAQAVARAAHAVHAEAAAHAAAAYAAADYCVKRYEELTSE